MDVIVRPLLIVVGIALALLAYLYLTQRSMLYFPDSASPSSVLLPDEAEAIELETADGMRLGAWFLPATDGSMQEAGPAVLVFNGNAGDRSHRLPLAVALTARGYAVLLFDYRGYAGNPGSPSEEGLRADARAAVEALATRPEVDPERIAYFGESLGAAVAGGLATERPPAALVLRSPPPSIVEMAHHHYPYLPVIDALLMDRYPLVEQIGNVRAPVLVIVTETDEIVPARLSRRVFEAASEPKRHVTVTAAHHNDPALLAGEELLAVVVGFLDEWVGRR
jgi:fermentation-respiration switch protein FrsA (DUF1100 family)